MQLGRCKVDYVLLDYSLLGTLHECYYFTTVTSSTVYGCRSKGLLVGLHIGFDATDFLSFTIYPTNTQEFATTRKQSPCLSIQVHSSAFENKHECWQSTLVGIGLLYNSRRLRHPTSNPVFRPTMFNLSLQRELDHEASAFRVVPTL